MIVDCKGKKLLCGQTVISISGHFEGKATVTKAGNPSVRVLLSNGEESIPEARNLKIISAKSWGGRTMKNLAKLVVSYFVVKYWVVNNELAQDIYGRIKEQLDKVVK